MESRIRKMSANVGALYRRLIEIVEVINDGNLPLAFRQQPVYKMRTDEPRAPGDKNGFHLIVKERASLSNPKRRRPLRFAGALHNLRPGEQRVGSKVICAQ